MELRAKEDIDGTDDAQEGNPDMQNKEERGEGLDDMDDVNINNEEKFPDSTKSEPVEQHQRSHEENEKSEPQSVEESMEDGYDGDSIIASHYWKDKIWLRRTRPNRCDDQVLITMDDSRSMLESECGNVTTKALVTVCCSMSQLEVGNLAVSSSGKNGNISLLHDFDHPFTREAGTKMISRLTFKQENAIDDEPVVELLKFMNNKHDDAVLNARLPFEALCKRYL